MKNDVLDIELYMCYGNNSLEDIANVCSYGQYYNIGYIKYGLTHPIAKYVLDYEYYETEYHIVFYLFHNPYDNKKIFTVYELDDIYWMEMDELVTHIKGDYYYIKYIPGDSEGNINALCKLNGERLDIVNRNHIYMECADFYCEKDYDNAFLYEDIYYDGSFMKNEDWLMNERYTCVTCRDYNDNKIIRKLVYDLYNGKYVTVNGVCQSDYWKLDIYESTSCLVSVDGGKTFNYIDDMEYPADAIYKIEFMDGNPYYNDRIYIIIENGIGKIYFDNENNEE